MAKLITKKPARQPAKLAAKLTAKLTAKKAAKIKTKKKVVIYCRVAWMNYYNFELCPMDAINYGGSHPIKHETYNFQKVNNWYYGFVQVPKKIDIVKRLGIKPGKGVAEDVLVIWVAKNPNINKQVVIGWYKDANVYSKYQKLHEEAVEDRKFINTKKYNISSKTAILLPMDLRTIDVSKNILGRSQFAYEEGKGATVKKIKKLLKGVMGNGINNGLHNII